MNLTTLLLKKDIRRSQVLLLVWLLLIVLQCVLVGSPLTPADRAMQVLYSMISAFVPWFQVLLLMVIIPNLVQAEALAGTTAFWFTRPISRSALLKEKALFVLLVLVLPPLLAELVVFAANGITPHDMALAVPEILMLRLSAVLMIATLAAVTSSFSRYAIAGVIVLVATLLLSTGITLSRLFLHPELISAAAQNMSLIKSRTVATSLLGIFAGGTVVIYQYLTRRTARSIAAVGISALAFIAVQTFWPWDFLQPGPVKAGAAGFDIGAVKVSVGPNVFVSDVSTIRGAAPPQKNLQAVLATEGLPPGCVVEVKKVQPRLRLPGGPPLNVQPPGLTYSPGGPSADALESALGGASVVNAGYDRFSIPQRPLFTLDAATYNQYVNQPLSFSADIDLLISKYVVAAEMPLIKGARYDRGSEHVIITDVLRQADGMEIVLREIRVKLLFDPRTDPGPLAVLRSSPVVYLLRNKARNEAIRQRLEYSFDMNLVLSASARLINQPMRLSFGPDRNRSGLDFELTDQWLAEAVLVRLELVPLAQFSKQVVVDNFSLTGRSSAASSRRKVTPNLEALGEIAFPEKADKAQVKEYVNAVLFASQRQDSFAERDPQVAMLTKIGSENLDVLVDIDSRVYATGAARYLRSAIQRLVLPEHKELILQALPIDHHLADVIVHNGWQADARDTLISELRREGQSLPAGWLKAVAALQDPTTYPDIKAYFVRCANPQQTFDAIKQLPDLDLADAVDQVWKKARNSAPFPMLAACGIAAEFGHLDALNAAVNALKKDRNEYVQNRAAAILQKYTTASGDHHALVAWFEANKDKLTFDQKAKKFVVQQ